MIDWGRWRWATRRRTPRPGWALFDAATREGFRAAAGFDDATWARGRGWALSTAAIALPYYRGTSPSIAANARATLAEVLADRP